MSRRKARTPAPAKRVAIYTRKSTAVAHGDDFSSLDAQYEACLGYVERQPGWMVTTTRYDDGGYSGGSMERPAFQRLMRDVDAGVVDVVVVYKLDRLSRSLRDFALLMDRFHRAGVSFVSVTQQFDTSTSMGKLTLHLLMSFAEFERALVSERTRDKIAASRRRGRWTGGPVPFGYRVEAKRLVIDEHEAAVVGELFALFLRHRQAAQVARELNDRGLLPRGTRVRARGELPRWSKDAVARVLRSPIYAGLISSGGSLHAAEHEAIVERDVWDHVQAILADRARETAPHGRNPAYILRGVLRCALCGSAMTPASTGKDRRGREYRYYRCSTRDKHGRKACPARPLPAGAIEEFIVQHLRDATRDGRLAHDVAHRLEAGIERQRKALVSERRALPPTIARLSAEVGSLAQGLVNIHGAARSAIERRIEEIGSQLANREARMAEVETSLAALDAANADAQWVAQALADFDAVWEMMSVENRGRLVRALVREVMVDEASGTVTAILVDLADETGDAPAEALQPISP